MARYKSSAVFQRNRGNFPVFFVIQVNLKALLRCRIPSIHIIRNVFKHLSLATRCHHLKIDLAILLIPNLVNPPQEALKGYDSLSRVIRLNVGPGRERKFERGTLQLVEAITQTPFKSDLPFELAVQTLHSGSTVKLYSASRLRVWSPAGDL